MTQSLSFDNGAAPAPTRAFGRLTGLLYLIAITGIGLTYGYSQMMPGADAAILGIRFGRGLFDLTLAVGAIGLVAYLLAALAFYRLFQNVSRTAAALLFVFVVASIPLSLAALARMMDIASFLDAAAGMTPPLAFEQLRMPVMQALHSYNSLMLMSAIFWGLWLIPLGWLVYRSRMAPRVVGVLLMIGSSFYFVAVAGGIFDLDFQATAAGRIVYFATFIPAMLGELGTILWLLVFGGQTGGGTAKS